MHAIKDTTEKAELNFTPLKKHTCLQEKQLNTAQTNSSAIKLIKDIDCEELFQRFEDFINVIEDQFILQQSNTTQRKLSYEDTKVTAKKLFVQEPIQNKASKVQKCEQNYQQRRQVKESQVKKQVAIDKVQMMTVKKNNKSFETPVKKSKQLKQQVLWATSKKLNY